MAYGQTNEAFRPGGARPAAGQRPNFNDLIARTGFESTLTDDLIPYVDANFRTMADQRRRAMAGLSMGGMETHFIALKRLDLFSQIGLFSGGVVTPDDVKNAQGSRTRSRSCFAVAAVAKIRPPLTRTTMRSRRLASRTRHTFHRTRRTNF